MLWLYLEKVYSLVDSGDDIPLISRETFDKMLPKTHSSSLKRIVCRYKPPPNKVSTIFEP